ncbi:unnamed protein product [Durusdinium trenchii]|uniref:Uncharacterized protein n=1 Tax=Durusdinium trenchii TaxID=1381693 RepID=A0ABP0MZN1_9DINO
MAKWRNASSNERMTMLENIRRKLLFGDGDHEQRQKLLRVVLRKVVASMSAPRHHVAGKRRQECQAETEPAGPSQQELRHLLLKVLQQVSLKDAKVKPLLRHLEQLIARFDGQLEEAACSSQWLRISGFLQG